jgi:hypothetical protein
MLSTYRVLRKMATVINTDGLHTGKQFAASNGYSDRFDICALAYIVAEDRPAPRDFFTDESASIRLIESSAGAMQAIRALSASLDSEPCETEIAPGMTVPDYIEHVSNWAATTPIGETTPPTTAEVLGRILRAADQATSHAA